MKKNLSKLLAGTLAVSSLLPTAAFAATDVSSDKWYATWVEQALENELMTGFPDGTFKPEEGLTRAQFAAIMVNVLGLEVDASAAAGFTDLSQDWYKGYIGAVVANDVFAGTSETTFNPDQLVDRQTLATVLVKALGFEAEAKELDLAPEFADADKVADWAAPFVAFAGELELMVGTGDNFEPTVKATRADAAAVAVKYFEGETEYKEAAQALVDELTAPDTVEVDSVEALNLIQVAVTFNSDELDADVAGDASNYTLVNASGNELDIADVAIDGDTVVLTLAGSRPNQSTATLTVDAALNGEEEEFEVSFFDTEIPTVLGAEVIGNDTVKVTFSEPLDFGTLDVNGYAGTAVLDAFQWNAGESFVKSVKVLDNGTAVNVEFYSTFDEGENTLSVSDELEDYAGFNLIAEDLTVDVVADTTAPELVEVKNVTPTTATLVFDEDIEPANGTTALNPADFYHTNTSNTATAATIVNGNQVRLTFAEANSLPNGTVYLYVKKDAVRDLWDNENEQLLSISAKVTVDTEVPTVKAVSMAAQNRIKVTFSEEVSADTAEDFDNYTLLDKDGAEKAIILNASRAANADGENVIVYLDLSTSIYGDHSLVIENVEDLAGNEMEKATAAFNAVDKVAPTFTGVTADLFETIGSTVETLVIDFNEEMAVEGKYSVLDLEKYVVGGENLADYSNVKISTLDSNSKVKITYNTATSKSGATPLDLEASDALVIARVADAAGNYTDALVSSPITVADGLTTYVGLYSLVSTAGDEIKVTLNDVVSNFNRDDFVITGLTTGTTVVGSKITTSGSRSVITFKLSQSQGTDLSDISVATQAAADVATQNRFGQVVQFGATTVEDYVAPKLATTTDLDGNTVANVTATGTTVTLVFSEDLNTSSVNMYSFKVNGYNVTAATAVGNTVTLTVANKTGYPATPVAGTSVTQAIVIYDANDNAVTGISTKVANK